MNRPFLAGPSALAAFAALSVLVMTFAGTVRLAAAQEQRPNIILAISDDQSYPHTGAYGDPIVRTPTFNRVARDGVLFTNAFVSSPSCTPSRGALLTGQDFWRLEEGGNLWSALPAYFRTYPDLLEDAGYFVGMERKGWGPGRNEGPAAARERNPAGPDYESFQAFLAERPAGQPFVYWFGSRDPHRTYEAGSGQAAGMNPAAVEVPGFLPDSPEVRSDILDYYYEIERFDRELGEILAQVEAAGELENTIVVVTSDNGMPFPRAKANLYEYGVHVPLAVMWPAAVPGGRVVHDFVSLTDLAPTFLEAAGVPVPDDVTGRSLLPLLRSGQSGHVEPERDHAVVGRERHAWVREDGAGYPARAIRTADYLYVLNLEPERWPAGDPDPQYSFSGWTDGAEGTGEGYGDIDASPSKDFLYTYRDEYPELFRLAFGKRPREELYVIADDPYQLHNVAGRPEYAAVKQRLHDSLIEHLQAASDPRFSDGEVAFDAYPYYGRRSPHAEGAQP